MSKSLPGVIESRAPVRAFGQVLAMTEWLSPIFAQKNEKLRIWITPAVAHDPDLRLRQWSLAAAREYESTALSGNRTSPRSDVVHAMVPSSPREVQLAVKSRLTAALYA